MRPGFLAEGPTWLGEVDRTLRRWQGGSVVAAVSGGADSVGLLRALAALAPGRGLRLSVAHLDHGARGDSSDADARFVAELAGTLGLPFDLGRWRPERPGHFESDARRARYAWLAEVALARGAAAVAVGHHRDDQAETILHRILRGTGPRGLAGMPARRPLAGGVTLVRPLLTVGRGEIRAYLESLGQPWREDATNADTARTRARIRHELLPRLAAEYNPRVAEALVRMGRLVGAGHRASEREAARLVLAGMRREPDGRVALAIGRLRARPLSLRAEAGRLLWREAGWPERAMDAGRWLRLARLMEARRGRLALGGGFEAVVEGDQLRLGPASTSPTDADKPLRLPIPGEAEWGGAPARGVDRRGGVLPRGDRPRSARAVRPARRPASPRPRPAPRRPLRAAGDVGADQAAERLLPGPRDPAGRPPPGPARLRPPGDRLGRGASDRRPGPEDRGDATRAGVVVRGPGGRRRDGRRVLLGLRAALTRPLRGHPLPGGEGSQIAPSPPGRGPG